MALGNPAMGSSELVPSLHTNPAGGYRPTPNSEPLGSETGAPPRPRYFSTSVPPVARQPAVVVAPETRDNRIVTLLAPLIGFTIYVGDAGVSPQNGYALIPGIADDFPLVGFQSLYAITDAPVFLRLQVKIFPILLAERERRL